MQPNASTTVSPGVPNTPQNSHTARQNSAGFASE
jgi:hypothetical protein